MKTNLKLMAFVAAVLLSLTADGKKQQQDNTVIVAYVTSWTNEVPDPSTMTHINYAFGHVNDTFDGVRIDNPDRLRMIVGLKAQNPALRVMLSVGGWGSGRFSEMAATNENRMAFARDCKRVVEEFGLDGIDIDWEYPTQSSAKISSSPQDTENFTLLMRDLRKVLGKQRLVTAATVCNANYIDFRSCIQYMDLVNVMAYDMGNAPKHHAALFPSPHAGYCTSSQAVEAHLKAGVPREKLVMGVPFYGKGKRDDEGLREYRHSGRLPEGYAHHWDNEGRFPYITNAQGEFVWGYENARSLAEKCQYILDNHLRGGMYWDYASDTPQGDERRTLYLSLLQNKKGTVAPRRVLVLAERGGLHEGFTAAGLQWLEDNRERFNIELTVLNSAKEIKKGEIPTYHLILQLNYPPYAWSSEAQQDMQHYIDRSQGGYIGFHHASLLGEFDGYPMWTWFSDFMGKIRYKNYIAEKCDGTVQVEDRLHPVMQGVPGTFVVAEDEWYTYEQDPRPNVHVLAHVDEASYTTKTDIKMGDHPVIWVNPEKPSRNVYFQFGHSKSLFDNPAFVTLLENSLRWTLKDTE
jgi:chitinase